jgi:predicted aspartyl protease
VTFELEHDGVREGATADMQKARATFLCFVWLFSATFSSGLPTRAAEPSVIVATNPVVLTYQSRRGHVMVPARLNGSNALSLLLDTGYDMTMLHPDYVQSAALRRTGRISIVGIAGEAPAGVFEGPAFDFGGVTWKPRRIAAFPPDNEGRSRRRDGVLGSGFFRRFVVEIDSRTKTITLREPDSYVYSGDGEILPLTFKGTTPIVDASFRLPDQSEVKAQLELDTGCDGALCLGKPFVDAHQLVPTNSFARTASGVGGSTRTRTGHLPQLQLGRLVIKKPSADFFLEGSPVDPPLAGHIGWELLRDFKVIFDYTRKRVILERAE